MSETKRHARRDFFGFAAVAVSGLIAAPAFAAPVVPTKRSLSFHDVNTNESLSVDYFQNGRYLPDAASRIAHVLRDYRADEAHAIDPTLLDLLSRLRDRLAVSAPFTVICGYRSPATNAMRRTETSGVAANSLHMQGRAIDLRVPGVSLAAVHQAAISLKAGGVGYYPHSDFVHLDVGPVRHW